MKEKGFREITLLGRTLIHTDIKTERSCFFPAAVGTRCRRSGTHAYSFTTSHPRDMDDEMLYAMSRIKIFVNILLACSIRQFTYVEINDRKYTREWYMDRIEAIRRILPDCSITTDLFCAFFQKQKKIIKRHCQ
jgi:tRNA-2-methylthio-N6-dimethylallyladenosine synthase